MRIRPEQPADFAAIAAVVEQAFGSTVEPQLIEAIRADACYRPELALVAEVDDDNDNDGYGSGDGNGGDRASRIVGHVMISHAELRGDDGTVRTIATLSPLAVVPGRQRQGIGSALVREVTRRADELGDAVVVLEGSPRYYPRFGFVDCRTLGITMNLPDWAPPDAGQAMPLSAYDPSLRGTVVYPPPFDGLE